MSKLDDLSAALDASATAVAAIGVNVGEIKAGVVALDTEVKDLIALIAQNPDVPQAVVDKAKAFQAQSETLVASTQAVEDQIAAVPKPAQG